MAFGFGGPGGHGGHGPGGHGGPGFGGHGPGFGGPGGHFGGHGFGGFGGFGFGRGGGFFGLGHFGPSGSASASGDQDPTNNWGSPVPSRPFPDNVTATRRGSTAKERVELFLIDHYSIKRAIRWLIALGVLMSISVTLTIALSSQIHLVWIILISPSIILSPLSYFLRNITSDLYGRPLANRLCLIACLPSLILAFITLILPFGSPRLFFAGTLAYLAGSYVSNWSYQISRGAQAIRAFDDNNQSYRARARSASIGGRFIELLIFVPFAFAGDRDFFALIWLGVCIFGLALLVETLASPLSCALRNRLIYHLSADHDYIVDEP